MGIYLKASWLYQDGNENARLLLKAFTGHDCVPTEGSTGQREDCQEGDIGFYDAETGVGYSVSYDFACDPTGEADCLELFRFEIRRDEGWDTRTMLNVSEIRELIEGLKSTGLYDDFTLDTVDAGLYELMAKDA